MSQSQRQRSGFTLVEMVISVGILTILGVTFTTSMKSMADLTHAGSARSNVQRQATTALETVLEDLRRSGSIEEGGIDYPHVFEDGEAGSDFDLHDHLVIPGIAKVGDYDFGTTREIILLLPDDFDQNGVPDIDGNGNLVWSPDEISYVLGTRADGTRVLERRTNGLNAEVILEDVERVVFEDAAWSGWVIPLDAVRVRIYVRALDEVGREVRYFVEGMARLRNG